MNLNLGKLTGGLGGLAEQKVKIVIIALIVLLGLSFLLYMQANTGKQRAEKEREALRAENEGLNKQLADAGLQNQQLQNRLNALNADVDQLSKVKEDLEKRLDSAHQEKADLIEQVQALKKKVQEVAVAAPAPAPPPAPRVPTGPVVTDEAYWAGVLKAKTNLELQIQGIRQQLREIQITNEQLQREKTNLALEVTNLNREKADLKRQIDYNQRIMDSIASELVREKNDKFQVQDNAKNVKEENATLLRQLKALNNRKVTLEKRLVDLQNNNLGLSNRVTELESILKDRMLEFGNLKYETDLKVSKAIGEEPPKESLKAPPAPAQESVSESGTVELPPIVVRPQITPLMINEAGIGMGKVLAINRDNNFVIMDLGEEQGIKAGNTFVVYRGEQPIADIEVVQVRQNISACDIKRETSPIKVGDTIR
jgi:predicted  nucleic acid-binding Zn-ribbon protein